MLEKFLKSLEFLGIQATDTSHVADEKNLYKFTDATVDKHWRAFYAFYKQGYLDACNKIGVLAVQEIGII